MKNVFIGIYLLTGTFISAAAQEESGTLQHTASWAAALQKAQKENKLLFVDCYFTGCHPCAQMDKEVFPNEMISKELKDNFVAVKVDVFKEKLGDTINIKYAVSGFPTFLILDAKGNLLSMFRGFQDAGLLLKELNAAKQKAKDNQTLSGFAAAYTDNYPAFYKKFYSRGEDKKVDPAAANAWIKQQKEWTAEAVALAIFRTRQLDTEVEDYVLANYKKYKAMYGDALLMDKASNILSARLAKMVNSREDEQGFRYFLSIHAKNFPAKDWKIIQFALAYSYYNTHAKNVTALLQFVNEYPVLHQNYYSSLYSNMAVKKELSEKNLKLMCGWADKTMNEESSLDLLRTAAYVHKASNDMDGFRKYMIMAIAKAKKYGISTASYEKLLTSN